MNQSIARYCIYFPLGEQSCPAAALPCPALRLPCPAAALPCPAAALRLPCGCFGLLEERRGKEVSWATGESHYHSRLTLTPKSESYNTKKQY